MGSSLQQCPQIPPCGQLDTCTAPTPPQQMPRPYSQHEQRVSILTEEPPTNSRAPQLPLLVFPSAEALCQSRGQGNAPQQPPACHTWLFSSCLGLWDGGGEARAACASLSARGCLLMSDLRGAIHFIQRSRSTSPQGRLGSLAARRRKSSS